MQKLLQFLNYPKQKAMLYTPRCLNICLNVVNPKCLLSRHYKQRDFFFFIHLPKQSIYWDQVYSELLIREILKASGIFLLMLFSVHSKLSFILTLACSLLTEVLSIAKNNIYFLNYFLAIFTETWKEIDIIRRGPDSRKRSCHK